MRIVNVDLWLITWPIWTFEPIRLPESTVVFRKFLTENEFAPSWMSLVKRPIQWPIKYPDTYLFDLTRDKFDTIVRQFMYIGEVWDAFELEKRGVGFRMSLTMKRILQYRNIQKYKIIPVPFFNCCNCLFVYFLYL